MKRFIFCLGYVICILGVHAQNNPAITSWLQNKTIMGRHYVKGNSTPIQDNVLANVQKVEYSSDWVYVSTRGIPAYITGPFQDGNPSLATDQNTIFKISLKPIKNEGALNATTGGNIGVFINGVALFDYRDGVAWNTTTATLCGGPGNPACPGGMGAAQAWNRDAIVAERAGFDCAKAHPAMGNYHHHQNPSAFNLDKTVISNVCDLYPADGLYKIDANKHSPLLGYAYDGFPIYGAYAFKNRDGTGPITRMKSGYQLRNITTRTHLADGTDVADGPVVSSTYPLGYFREDYVYIASADPDKLDDHNGRFCVTPEYPNGVYCYFTTVDDSWNSAYPYVVGPTFYGIRTASRVANVGETVNTYVTSTSASNDINGNQAVLSVFPNPASDYIAVQFGDVVRVTYLVQITDLAGKKLAQTSLLQGSSLAFFDVSTLYAGEYIVTLYNQHTIVSKKILIIKE